MKAFHLVGPAPFYTNSFLLISDAGNAVVIDPACMMGRETTLERVKAAIEKLNG